LIVRWNLFLTLININIEVHFILLKKVLNK
jgi:hypothetical protein